MAGGVPLSAAIESLRTQLLMAINNGADRGLMFSVSAIELELQVTLTAGNEVDGSVGGLWSVLSIGAKASREREISHTLRLSLTPVRTDNGRTSVDVLIGDQLNRPPA